MLASLGRPLVACSLLLLPAAMVCGREEREVARQVLYIAREAAGGIEDGAAQQRGHLSAGRTGRRGAARGRGRGSSSDGRWGALKEESKGEAARVRTCCCSIFTAAARSLLHAIL